MSQDMRWGEVGHCPLEGTFQWRQTLCVRMWWKQQDQQSMFGYIVLFWMWGSDLHWVKLPSLGTCFPRETTGPWRETNAEAGLLRGPVGIWRMEWWQWDVVCVQKGNKVKQLWTCQPRLLVTLERNVCWPGTTTSLVTPEQHCYSVLRPVCEHIVHLLSSVWGLLASVCLSSFCIVRLNTGRI